jgi:DNA adenine methylase
MDACGRFRVAPEKIVVYADPPYLASSRKSERRMYRYELGEVEHRALLRCLKDLPCCVVVQHYPCEMYDEALSGWRSFEYSAMTRRGLATEKVWLNFPKAKVLHDVRWLGSDKRVREKLNRRRKNLMRRIRSLPENERQWLLAELVG